MARTSITAAGAAFAAAVLVVAPFFGAAGPEAVSSSPAGAVAASGSSADGGVVIRMIDGVATPMPRADQRERAEAVARASAEEPAALAAAAVAKSGRDAAAAAEAAARAAAAVADAPACAGMPGGATAGAPGGGSPLGVTGTTSSDLAQFAQAYNQIRVSNCLPPIPYSSIRYDSCMEQRLFWMAEDPSTDPLSAWGHAGSQRSDGMPSVGCDGNLAGGTGNTGASVAQKWWDSGSHRASLYRPGASVAGVCILFSMTHGGVPNEPHGFTRAAARWTSC